MTSRRFTVLDLFSAAAGGWSLGLHRAGFVTVAACEIVEWRRILYSENFPHDWNGGLAHHLRLDDGLSAWVADTRIALGSRKGPSAASLIVEAFGDAVLPQIPEIIGRAILRTEAALGMVLGAFPHSDHDSTDDGVDNGAPGDGRAP